jgi:hypothetical protein
MAPAIEGKIALSWYNIVIFPQICGYIITGEPLSERAMRGNNSIRILTDEEQEGVKQACRVSL